MSSLTRRDPGATVALPLTRYARPDHWRLGMKRPRCQRENPPHLKFFWSARRRLLSAAGTAKHSCRRGDVLRVHERARPGSAGSPRRSLPPRSRPASTPERASTRQAQEHLAAATTYREMDIVSGLSRKTEHPDGG